MTESEAGERGVYFNRPQADRRYSALYKFDMDVRSVSGKDPVELTFRFHEANQTFKRAVSAEQPTFWLALNTHLLPNGVNTIDFSLQGRDGEVLGSERFQMNVLNDGPLAARVRESLSSRNSPLIFDGLVDSQCFDIANQSLLPWYDRPDAREHVRKLFEAGEITSEEAHALTSLATDGYVQLSEPIEPETILAANAAIDDTIAKGVQGYKYGSSQRIEHLHGTYNAIHDLWKHPKILRFLRLVFEVEPLPCQTLTYVFGSEQDLHQDTVHLTSFPPGHMCGVWIALEDIQPNSGELMVVPGSHRLERVYRQTVDCGVVANNDWSEFGAKVLKKWEQMNATSGLTPTTYRPKAGTVLIWLDSLLHGGSKRVDLQLTRRSLVSHYFASGSVAYYDATGLPGFTIR